MKRIQWESANSCEVNRVKKQWLCSSVQMFQHHWLVSTWWGLADPSGSSHSLMWSLSHADNPWLWRSWWLLLSFSPFLPPSLPPTRLHPLSVKKTDHIWAGWEGSQSGCIRIKTKNHSAHQWKGSCPLILRCILWLRINGKRWGLICQGWRGEDKGKIQEQWIILHWLCYLYIRTHLKSSVGLTPSQWITFTGYGKNMVLITALGITLMKCRCCCSYVGCKSVRKKLLIFTSSTYLQYPTLSTCLQYPMIVVPDTWR